LAAGSPVQLLLESENKTWNAMVKHGAFNPKFLFIKEQARSPRALSLVCYRSADAVPADAGAMKRAATATSIVQEAQCH
jgi:hypothetical protein